MAGTMPNLDPSSQEVRFERGIPLNPRFTGEIFDPPEPLLPELAAAAAPKKVIPTAGSYAVERFTLPDDLEVPPESMINEGDFFPFSLNEDKMPPFVDRDLLKNIPKELLESEGDKPYVFTPLQKNPSTKIHPDPSGNFNAEMDADVTQRLNDMKIIAANATVAEVKHLQEEQQEIKATVAPTPTKSGVGVVDQKARSRSKSKGKVVHPPQPNPKPKKYPSPYKYK